MPKILKFEQNTASDKTHEELIDEEIRSAAFDLVRATVIHGSVEAVLNPLDVISEGVQNA